MKYEVSTVEDYLNAIPPERREVISKLLEVIGNSIPDGFELAMSYGFPGYVVPHSVYPAGYHVKPEEPLPFVSAASQKNFIGLYHMGLYSFPEHLKWFQSEWEKLGIGKLDMGKSCIRLKNPAKIPYELIGELCSRISCSEWIAEYEKSIMN